MIDAHWLTGSEMVLPFIQRRTLCPMTARASGQTPRRLGELVPGLGLQMNLPSDPVITGITADSRETRPGDLFVAIRGFATDGHRFVGEAVVKGAVAVVLEDETYAPVGAPSLPVIVVPNSRKAAGQLAAEFYGHPSHKLCLVGVTGTNGKTTVSLLMDSIFRSCGHKTGVVGTLGRSVAGEWRGGERTTPDAIELQRLLAEMNHCGVTHVSMEVSSHALDLDRVVRCRFAGGIFTNLTQDHLDYHVSLDEYLQAKLRLFTTCADESDPGNPMVAAINADDPAGQQVAQAARARVIMYGTNGGSEVRARSVSLGPNGSLFELVIGRKAVPVELKMPGHFNVHNALAAAACAYGLGVDIGDIIAGLESLEAVPGRFERVSGARDYSVIVDYAHTPMALDNILRAARNIGPKRIICVMGCGGDRDRGKRPKMGKVSADLADITIVTSDNPRSEDPLAIIEDIKGGLAGGTYEVVPDRREAIFRAVELAEPGDMVVIAGKGHETYQEFADHRIDFDDRIVAREAIEARDA